jgi:hypothetical protein
VVRGVVKPILVRERHARLGILEPDLVQPVVDCAGDDVHVRERATEVCDAAAASHEEGDKDYVRRVHAVVEENADGHESRRARADLRPELTAFHKRVARAKENEKDMPAHREERPMRLLRDVFRGCNWAVWHGKAVVLPFWSPTVRAGSLLARH